MTLAPDFAVSHGVYLYYSHSTTDVDTTASSATYDIRLSRFTWTGSSLNNEQVLFSIPSIPNVDTFGNHFSGPIAFGPDGKIYGVIGDQERSGGEQNKNASPASVGTGGIYRLNTDGSIPIDNPFLATADPGFWKWYGYGMRNSFGLAFDPATGNLWETENGTTNYDEINMVTAGFNGGWTTLVGPISRTKHTTADMINLPGSTYSDPKFSFFTEIVPTGIQFLYGSQLGPAYNDAVIVSGDAASALNIFRLNASRTAFVFTDTHLNDLVLDSTDDVTSLLFGRTFGFSTLLQMGPDGALYDVLPATGIGTSFKPGTIYRISAKNLVWIGASNNSTWDAGGTKNWWDPSIDSSSTADAAFANGRPVALDDTALNFTITLNGTLSPSFLAINNSQHDYTITGNGGITGSGSLTKIGAATVTLGTTNTYTGPTAISAGTLVVANSAALPPTTALTVGANISLARVQLADGIGTVTLGSLKINPGSTFDLGNNALVIPYAGSSPISLIRSYLASGFNFGTWDGPGINSIDAHNDITDGSAIGYLDNGSTVTLKYTYYGDSNLDGKVDLTDFQMFLDGLVATNAGSWAQGDYTYDGIVDLGNDFNLFLSGYMTQGAPLGELADVITSNPSLSATQKAQLLSAVPEPSASTALLASCAFLARRRRRE